MPLHGEKHIVPAAEKAMAAYHAGRALQFGVPEPRTTFGVEILKTTFVELYCPGKNRENFRIL
jgi:hypothetical protein